MKSFKQFIAEMDLSREPPDYENIEDRRGERVIIKAGDKKISAAGGGTYTQAEADAINKKNNFDYPKVNKKYGDSGIPMPKFPETNKKTASVEKPKTQSVPLPKPNAKPSPGTTTGTKPKTQSVPLPKPNAKPSPGPKPNAKPATQPDKPYNQAEVDKRRSDILKKANVIVAKKTKELTTLDSTQSRVNNINKSLRTPPGQRGSTSAPTTRPTAPSVATGMANPEWIKKHSWINDAIKQDRVKRDKIAASTTTGGPRGPNGPSSPPSKN